MLTRRHIRVKVLQSLYAFYQSESQDLEKQEKFLLFSIHQMQELHALMLHLLVALRNHAEKYQEKSKKKFLATDTERNPSRSFVDNKAIALIEQEEELNQFLKNTGNGLVISAVTKLFLNYLSFSLIRVDTYLLQMTKS